MAGAAGSAPRVAAAALVVAALTALAYLPVHGAGFVWDDPQYVVENSVLTSPSGLADIWFRLGSTPQYYPAVFTSFWIESRLWGFEPAGYHAVNVALHAIVAALAGVLLSRLSVPGAWLAAALFALHPVHVESVAWITERKNVLSAAFYLGSLVCLVRATRIDGRGEPRRPRLQYAAALALFVLALLSKTVSASLPAAFLLLAWWRSGSIGKGPVRAAVPFFVLGAALAAVTVWMERHHVGAQGETWDISAPERALVAGRAVWFYLGKLAWPSSLSFNYARWEIDAGSPLAWVAPLAAAAVPVALIVARRRIGRGPAAAALYFGGTLVPALGFFDVFPFRYSYVADHFQYLASLGPIALVAAGAARLRLSSRWRSIVGVVSVAALVTLGTLTWVQCRIYENLEALWLDTLRKNPASWLANNNLGTLLMDDGRFVEAERHFRAAVEAAPRYHESRNNLAVALARQGRTEEALDAARQAVSLSPRHTGARNTLGLLLARAARLDEAEAEFREAIRLDPDYSKAHAGLGTVLVRSGRVDEGIGHLREAVRLAPRSAETHANLASALSAAGRREEALEAAAESVRLAPEDPRIRALFETLPRESSPADGPP